MNEKSILITGCSSGIGLASARYLAARGWRVLATCRSEADAARLRAGGLESFALDLADDSSVASGAQEALARTGGQLFAVFHNGAFAIPGATEDLPRAALRSIFETNLFGQLDLANRILPAMHKAGRGRMIFNSSVLGMAALRYRGAYVGTKFAMEGMVDCLRLENPCPGIHHILIEPGPVTSLIRQNAQAHFERHIDPEHSVHAAVYEKALKPRLYDRSGKKDPFELPPEAVAEKLFDAVTRKNPPPRYFVTTPTYISNIARRILPTRTMDRFAKRFG